MPTFATSTWRGTLPLRNPGILTEPARSFGGVLDGVLELVRRDVDREADAVPAELLHLAHAAIQAEAAWLAGSGARREQGLRAADEGGRADAAEEGEGSGDLVALTAELRRAQAGVGLVGRVAHRGEDLRRRDPVAGRVGVRRVEPARPGLPSGEERRRLLRAPEVLERERRVEDPPVGM